MQGSHCCGVLVEVETNSGLRHTDDVQHKSWMLDAAHAMKVYMTVNDELAMNNSWMTPSWHDWFVGRLVTA
jgi:hypothetical protein